MPAYTEAASEAGALVVAFCGPCLALCSRETYYCGRYIIHLCAQRFDSVYFTMSHCSPLLPYDHRYPSDSQEVERWHTHSQLQAGVKCSCRPYGPLTTVSETKWLSSAWTEVMTRRRPV